MKKFSVIFYLILSLSIVMFSCGENKEKPAEETETKATPEQVPDTNMNNSAAQKENLPPEVKVMLADIENCLANAIDNSNSEDQAKTALDECKKNLWEKYKDKVQSDSVFKKFFEEEGQIIYNSQKIRMKDKFSKK